MAVRDLLVRLRADTAQYKTEMAAAGRATDQANAAAGRVGATVGGAANTFEQSARKVQQFHGRMLAVGAAGAVVVHALDSVLDSASRLEQSIGATESVFKGASGTIGEFAEGAAQSVGLAESEFRELSTVTGASLKNMGFAVDEAADKSIGLVQIGADLSATFGGTTKDAVQALTAAFRGEADPAEKYGLRLQAGAVTAKALEMGLAATASQVDKNARAQATLALIMEQTTDVAGQFAREADTLAGAQARANAEFEDAKAVLGSKLIPVVSDATNQISNLIQMLTDPSWANFGDILEQGVVNSINAVSFGLINLDEQMRGNEATAEDWKRAFDEGDATLEHLRVALDRGRITAKEFTDITGEQVEGQRISAAQAKLNAEAIERQTEEQEELTEAMETYVASLRASIDPFFAVLDAEKNLVDANQKYTDALALNSDEIEDNNVSAAEMEQLDRDVADAALDLEGRVSDLALAVANGDLSYEESIATLQRLRDQGLINEDQFNRMKGQIDALSGRHVQITTAAETAQAQAALDALIAKMRIVTAGGTFVITGGSSLAREQKAKGGIEHGGANLIQWAEPETGGEAWIPRLGISRSRAADLLGTAAAWHGFTLLANAQGGIVNGVTLPFRVDPNWSSFTPFAPALSAGIGWQAMWAALKGALPWVQLFSAFRPGAITATGNKSLHGMGRAIDVTPSMDVFNWIKSNYGGSKEIIYSPAGGSQVRNGRDHYYGEPTRGDHFSHVHWGMQHGGVMGGRGPVTVNLAPTMHIHGGNDPQAVGAALMGWLRSNGQHQMRRALGV